MFGLRFSAPASGCDGLRRTGEIDVEMKLHRCNSNYVGTLYGGSLYSMSARFRLSDEQLKEVRQALRTEEKVERSFTAKVRDEGGMLVAEDRVLHIRKREGSKGRPAG